MFIRGASLVRQITDPEIVAAVREEYVTDTVFEDHLPVTVESVQIEAFEGRQYMTVIAKDKNGMCVSSARGYALGKLTSEEFGCIGSFCKKCQVDSGKCACAKAAFPDNPLYPGTCSEHN